MLVFFSWCDIVSTVIGYCRVSIVKQGDEKNCVESAFFIYRQPALKFNPVSGASKVVEKLLLYIKHNLKPLWVVIECCNEMCLKIIYKKQIDILEGKYRVFHSTNNEFEYRLITSADLDILHGFLSRQDNGHMKYFSPHSFAIERLNVVLKSKNYLTFGYFHNNQIIGYFMMRLFANKKAFFGYIVGSAYIGKNIGKEMVRIMYTIATDLGWEAYATISKKNIPSLRVHNYETVKQLPKEYMLVRFID